MDSTSTIRPLTSEVQATEGVQAAGLRDGNPAQRPATDPQTPAVWSSQLYEPILGPLAEVEQRLHLELRSPHEGLVPLLRHGTQLGGKRLRPAMLLLAASATGKVSPDHIVLATVIEMVHTATLVHDDVLDQAQTRRHVPTVNARWDEHTSILLGDYLFAQSFRLAATLPSTEACRWIGEAARLVCEGELRQVLHRDALDLDETTYLQLIRGKTAELCRVACQLGAKFSGVDAKTVQVLGDYGEAAGTAFQIADDYLDLWGDDRQIGKTLGTDVQQGKITLPIIRLLQTANRDDQTEIIRILSGPAEKRIDRIRPYLTDSDAEQYTRGVAERFRQMAVQSLSHLADSPAKTSLLAIAQFSVDRRF